MITPNLTEKGIYCWTKCIGEQHRFLTWQYLEVLKYSFKRVELYARVCQYTGWLFLKMSFFTAAPQQWDQRGPSVVRSGANLESWVVSLSFVTLLKDPDHLTRDVGVGCYLREAYQVPGRVAGHLCRLGGETRSLHQWGCVGHRLPPPSWTSYPAARESSSWGACGREVVQVEVAEQSANRTFPTKTSLPKSPCWETDMLWPRKWGARSWPSWSMEASHQGYLNRRANDSMRLRGSEEGHPETLYQGPEKEAFEWPCKPINVQISFVHLSTCPSARVFVSI